MSRLSIPSSRLILPGIAGILLMVAVMIVWKKSPPGGDSVPQQAPAPYAALDLRNPTPSFLLLQYVSGRGGDPITRQSAIDWLSEQARLRKPLAPDQENWLFCTLESGGHTAWDIEYKLWLFNDAFNALHMARDQQRLTRLLVELATAHPHKTMRLYALQHIKLQRDQDHLAAALAPGVRATLKDLAQAEGSEVAGTALVNLAAWDGHDTQPGPELIALALAHAADTTRAADIRVTALHAAGGHALELARAIAADTTQPVHLRKAAIGCIGIYGGETDLPALETLSVESARIAQAAAPASRTIRHRLSTPNAPAPVPF